MQRQDGSSRLDDVHPRCCSRSRLHINVPSSISSATAGQLLKCLLVVTWNDLSPGRSFQLLQALGAPEPSRMISGQPALWDPIAPLQTSHQHVAHFLGGKAQSQTHILDNVTMVTDEQKGPTVGHVDLHTDQSWLLFSLLHY